MQVTQRTVPATKTIALVAHDGCKSRLLKWVGTNIAHLRDHPLVGTGTTSTMIRETYDLPVKRMLSGPLGGDQQLGALIAEGGVDVLIFFWDPLNAAPHDPDVKALLRLATLWNVVVAMNEATADALIRSSWMVEEVTVSVPDCGAYVQQRAETLPGAPKQ